mgnify:CR=1 FL=1
MLKFFEKLESGHVFIEKVLELLFGKHGINDLICNTPHYSDQRALGLS